MPSADYYAQLIKSSPTLQKFLQTIGWAEGATYNTGYGGRYIPDLSWHPYNVGQFKIVDSVSGKQSTTSAAGMYQFERKTWNYVASALGLQSFDAQNQDIAAVKLIDDKGQLQNVLNGNITGAVSALQGVWQGFKTKGVQNVANHFSSIGGGVSANQQPNTQTQVNPASDFSKYLGVSVISDKNRYLLAFVILVIIFIFAFN